MKNLAFIILILMGTVVPTVAQESAVASKRLNFAYTHGSPDYVDLSSLGANVFPAGIDNQMVKARNLKSFVVNFRGWRLLDEYIVDPEFFWELDPIALKGKIRTVNYEKISKYPSLAKRYKAIKPVGVNYIVCVDLNSIDQDGDGAASSFRPHQVCFRAQSYQMFWGPSRSGRAASYPGALLGWKEGISTASLASRFLVSDNSDVNRLKNIVSKFRSVAKYSGSPTNTWLDIRWPDEAIDQIYEDFEEYEKKGKDLEKEYKEAKEEPKAAKRSHPLAADDEMARPYESAIKTAVEFRDDTGVGLKTPSGRIIFSSKEYEWANGFNAEKSIFLFSLNNPAGDASRRAKHLRKASGRLMKINNHDEFWDVIRHDDLKDYYGPYKYHPSKGLVPPGSFSLLVDLPGSTVYKSRVCEDKPEPVDPEDLAQLQNYETKRIKDWEEEQRKKQAEAARTGKVILEYGFGGDRWRFEYRQGLRIIVDSKFKVIREQSVLIPFQGAKC